MASAINLQEYSSEWARSYELDRSKIAHALEHKVVAIEHVGSTSIPGMVAKPIIDIAVLIGSFAMLDQGAIDTLSAIDYEYVHKPEFPTRRFFRRGLWGAGTHHLHIFEEGSLEWIRMLTFRDYLRADPKARQQYAELKRRLAATSEDRHSYTEAKGSFIRNVLFRTPGTRQIGKVFR
jgi:GrpB-like predicted nucleotidyltransferase (UPF0157 family)